MATDLFENPQRRCIGPLLDGLADVRCGMHSMPQEGDLIGAFAQEKPAIFQAA